MNEARRLTTQQLTRTAPRMFRASCVTIEKQQNLPFRSAKYQKILCVESKKKCQNFSKIFNKKKSSQATKNRLIANKVFSGTSLYILSISKMRPSQPSINSQHTQKNTHMYTHALR